METKINNLTIKIEELEAKINGLNGLNNSDNAPKEDKLKTQENIAKYKTTLIHNKTILLYLCFAFIPTNPEINA